MYAIELTEDTVEFIGTYLNNGTIPALNDRERVYFVFGDDKPTEIVPMNEFVMRFPYWNVVRQSALFRTI